MCYNYYKPPPPQTQGCTGEKQEQQFIQMISHVSNDVQEKVLPPPNLPPAMEWIVLLLAGIQWASLSGCLCPDAWQGSPSGLQYSGVQHRNWRCPGHLSETLQIQVITLLRCPEISKT